MSSLESWLDEVADRGSWIGGGSVAAVSAALAAALLEKLVVQPQRARSLRRVRRECVQLVQRDAEAFARVVRARRHPNRQTLQRALKAATEVPWRVFKHAQALQLACRTAQRSVKPQFQSDLRCAMALALASCESARTLIHTNLAWLNDPRSTRQMRRRMQAATRSSR